MCDFADMDLLFGSWNVRSLVECSGDVRICRSRPVSVAVSGNVDRKLDLLVKELKRYHVCVAGIQETKWFGKDVWPAVDGCTFLHSGRPLPEGDAVAHRGEGVGIFLDSMASKAWRQAGEVWKAISSRIVLARLRWTRSSGEHHGYKRSPINVTVICVYAPTAAAPPGVQSKFRYDLQDTIDAVPRDDFLVLLEDFNARVGVLGPAKECWRGIVGRHGLDERNESGEELLQFCAMNQLTVMNTWFKKKSVRYGTWTHPATGVSHMIDLVMMRMDQRMYCKDVSVMRGANCWTDHRLVRAKLRFRVPHARTGSACGNRSFSVYKLLLASNRDAYVQCLEDILLDRPYRSDQCNEDNWQDLRCSIVQAAEKSIGRGKRRQPEWFEDNVEKLTPLIDAKNAAYDGLLGSDSAGARRVFRQAQRRVKKAVDRAKEDWILNVAREAEEAVKDGRTRWVCIRRLQQAYAGRRPCIPRAVRKNDGELTDGPSEVLQRWYQHFSNLLNQQSNFDEEVIQRMPTVPPYHEFDRPPSMEELEVALSRLKKRKAGGKTGILPELLLCGGPVLRGRLLQLMQDIWRDGEVVADWKDAEIVPVPKNGDLQSCDNWRGISLLDVVGKLFARIIQERLQHIAEDILPESQCGFRKGRGCCDMIFVARQLVEKAREHQDLLFTLFVDLRKAYDSVPRLALWQVLEKSGVPPQMLKIIASFHEDMQAEVRIGGVLSESFRVRNGLRQGCTLAPTLFNLFFSAVVSTWRTDCVEVGVNVLSHPGRKLVGDRTAKSRLAVVKVTESQFADDLALYASTREKLERVTAGFVRMTSRWGLTVNVSKTKGMAFGDGLSAADIAPLQTDSGEIEMVNNFTYLGSVVSSDGEILEDIRCRLAKASRVFGCLQHSVFANDALSVGTRRAVYEATVLAVLLYGAETWTLMAPYVR